jgi:hypothetical protein
MTKNGRMFSRSFWCAPHALDVLVARRLRRHALSA